MSRSPAVSRAPSKPEPPPRRAAAAPPARATPPSAAAAPEPAKNERPLFERLGGLPAIKAVVEEFVARTTTDDRIKDRFFNTDATRLKAMLVELVCQATGGPCQYTGRDMKSAHGGMVLVDEEFDALVEDLVAALDKFQVPAAEKGQLLGPLAALRPEVVAPKDRLRPISRAKLKAAAKLAARLEDPEAARLVGMAVTAGRRGQRSYAEQLFSRAELITGARALAPIAGGFRAGAPPRITAPLRSLPLDSAPQPKRAAGGSEDDEPTARPARSSLAAKLLLEGSPLAGVGVVMLEPLGGPRSHGRVPKQRIVEQRGQAFAPHVLAVPVGSTVSFPNFDPVYHNVFSLSTPAPFDLGLYRNGESREIRLEREGVVRLGCNIHPSMAAYVIVVSSPHYAVADASGVATFKRLAPGRYRVVVRSGNAGLRSTVFRVR